MESQNRLPLMLGLMFLVTVLYVTFFAPKPPPVVPPPAPVAATHPEGGSGAVAVAPGVPGPAGSAAEAAEVIPVRELRQQRSLVHYDFSSQGAGLREAELQGRKMTEQQTISLVQGWNRLFGKPLAPPPQMNMAMPVPGLPLPLSISVVGLQPLPADLTYKVSDEKPGRLVFTGKSGSWEVEKTLEWQPEGFELQLTVQLKNIGASAAAGELAVHYARAIDPAHEEKGSFIGGVGNQSRAACFVGDDYEHLVPKNEPPKEFKGPIHFFGIDQQYFVSAIYPLEAARDGRCVLGATATERVVDGFFPLTVAPGEAVTQRFGVYLGPKDSQLLALVPASSGAASGGAVQVAGYRPQLEKTVDFGIWAVICKVLLAVLKFFYGLVHNWGVAIILLTVLAKILLLPLTHKSMVSAEAMKKLQPRIKEIQAKYPTDKERQNTETMKVYQEAKVNPLGGCLPVLIQLPIWGALFTTLRASYELYREPFLSPLWMDLTYKDPTYLLPLALGVAMIITQKSQPQMMDAAQTKVMTYVMPVFFTVIMLNYPAGLALYIFTNNLLQIAQQYALRRYLERKGIAEPRVGTARR